MPEIENDQKIINNPYRIMLVDDSSVIRNILRKILQDIPFIRIIGEAENGLIAVERAMELKPEIILLDIEMPEMDGITALPHILKASPDSHVIMVSTLTEKNAEISIRAMNRGASDYLQKPEANIDKEVFKNELLAKIKALGTSVREKKIQKLLSTPFINTSPATNQGEFVKQIVSKSFKPMAIAIASSTGGPQALQILFDGLKNNLPNLPIFITQHMPPVFTKFLANSLASDNNIKCHEAEDGMEALPGNVYIAPGDFHMLAVSESAKIKIKLSKEQHENYCRPSAEPMLRSLLESYGHRILVVILTGMGQDGSIASKVAAAKGSVVIAQDKATSIVWGMPGAVCSAGITSGIYPIDKIAGRIIEICGGPR